MKMLLNPYALIIEANQAYHFIISEINDGVSVPVTNAATDCITRLLKGERIEKSKLATALSKDVVLKFIEMNILCEQKPDTTSMFSRTDAFFNSYKMPYAREKLLNSSVLILGLGGIGSHMAWHMITLGVKKLTLLDFDTVEESNFNRQLLYTQADIGKDKGLVLKEKLQSINPSAEINTISARIASEEQLERICTAERYDLIIKALDSPAEFPLWIDHVCKKHRLKYITGITMRDSVMVGPTFIPGVNEVGLSDLIPVNPGVKHIGGTAPSLGIMLYHISSELAIEAVKVLTGYGTLSYTGKMAIRNLITNEEQFIGPAAVPQAKEVPASSQKPSFSTKALVLGLVLTAILGFISSVSMKFLPLTCIALIRMPYYLFTRKKSILTYTFISAAVFWGSLIIGVLITGRLASMAGNVVQILSLAALLFGSMSCGILLTCLLNIMFSSVIHL